MKEKYSINGKTYLATAEKNFVPQHSLVINKRGGWGAGGGGPN